MDAETILVDYLNGQGLGTTAYYDVPRSRPASFIVIEQTGGVRSDLVVYTPMLDIQCWAGSRKEAAALAREVVGALGSMPETVAECFHASIVSQYRDTDLESGTPRYHIVCELTLVDN